tara:strand:+ start:166 stop:483 length:318 start_codon:yes stop_codon:yes gene_type:complete
MSAEKRLQRKLDRMGKKSGNSAEVEDGKLEVNEFIQDNSKGGKRKRAEKLASKVYESSPLYGKISSACKAAAKSKFKVWPSAYASGWGVRCTKAGGPGKFGGKKK